MHLTEPHRDLLARIGTGAPLWPVLYEWQAARNIPAPFFKPEATLARLQTLGLIQVDGDTVRLTALGLSKLARTML